MSGSVSSPSLKSLAQAKVGGAGGGSPASWGPGVGPSSEGEEAGGQSEPGRERVPGHLNGGERSSCCARPARPLEGSWASQGPPIVAEAVRPAAGGLSRGSLCGWRAGQSTCLVCTARGWPEALWLRWAGTDTCEQMCWALLGVGQARDPGREGVPRLVYLHCLGSLARARAGRGNPPF